MKKKTQYLGFINSEDGIMADSDKVKVMREMLQPACVRELRSFISMYSYYRFILSFSAIMKPLTRLTMKITVFEWSKECQAALTFLKRALQQCQF